MQSLNHANKLSKTSYKHRPTNNKFILSRSMVIIDILWFYIFDISVNPSVSEEKNNQAVCYPEYSRSRYSMGHITYPIRI